MEMEGDPFFPALSCDSRVCGGSCTEYVSPRPGRLLEDRVVARRLPWACWRGRRPSFFFFLPAAGVLDHLGDRARCPPSSPSQLCDMEGIAGGQVGRHLRLEPVNVAAVAEQVTFQWITAVTLFVV